MCCKYLTAGLLNIFEDKVTYLLCILCYFVEAEVTESLYIYNF